MPKRSHTKLTLIAQAARRAAIENAMVRFKRDRKKVMKHFRITSQAISMILATDPNR